MNRDGQNKSLWQNTNAVSPQSAHSGSSYDVIIAGAGITGITAGYLLQKAGKKCLIIEPENIAYGTTGGTTAHINTFYDAQYDQVIDDFGEEKARLLAQTGPEVISQIETLINAYSIDCEFSHRDSYVFSTDEKQTEDLDKFFEATVKVGLPATRVSENPFPLPFQKIFKVAGQAQFHPTKYVNGLAKAYEQLGGEFLFGSRATGTDENEDLVTVKTDNSGNLVAASFIWATHVVPNINRMNFLAAPYRSYALAFTLKNGNYPEAQAQDMAEAYHYYRTQEIEGKKFVIAGGEDHKTAHEENQQEHLRRLEAHIRRHFDVDEVTHRWSSQYYTPVDGLPFIGKEPGREHCYWATGYDGNGMTFGTLSAMVITDLILTGESKYRELFDPSRLNVSAGVKDAVKENADAIFHLIKDKFTAEKIESLDEIKNGEGKTVSYKSKTMSVYRDETGALHAVSSSCTHMGCNVAFNDTEKTWDCPCHGARYGLDGSVLTGPATRSLDIIKIEE